jgi:endonuclease G
MPAKPKTKKAASAKRVAKKVAKRAAAPRKATAKKAAAKSAAARAPAKKVAAKRAAPKKRTKAMSHDAKIEVFKRFVREHHDRFLNDPNITSVGIGYKTAGGKATKTPVVTFSVQQKVAPEHVENVSESPIPKTFEYEGIQIPTDVVQRSFSPSYLVVEAVAKDPRKVRNDPIAPGVSVANYRSTAGTLGALVRNRQTGDVVMLSNWHVLHTSKGAIGDVIVQPGPFDDNRVANNRVGVLLRSHLGLAGDCAIASIEGRKINQEVFGLGVPVRKIAKPQLGDKVVKSGRTTGITYGIVTRIETVTKLEYGDGVKEHIGGFEIGPDPKRPADLGEISKGGDSGSMWLATNKKGAATDIALGLHFAGDEENSDGEYALACCAYAVFEKLELEPLGAAATAARPAAVTAEAAEEEQRTGFDNAFLGFEVPDPRFETKVSADLAKLNQSTRIDYCHFSVWLSKSRKFPRVVAWSIDGGAIRKLDRTGIPFIIDDRGGLERYQIGDELYSNNPLDRGHIARRADLCWGPLREARLANKDSFYFSNITPQHQRFNQGMRGGLWGQLEDAIFEDVKLVDLRVSLMGGPILRREDPLYRDLARVPREFWKLVAYTDEADGENKVRAYILTQRDLVKNLPEVLELDEFHWYQVPLSRIEKDTGLRFSKAFKDLDTASTAPESLGGANARRIDYSQDFFA